MEAKIVEQWGMSWPPPPLPPPSGGGFLHLQHPPSPLAVLAPNNPSHLLYFPVSPPHPHSPPFLTLRSEAGVKRRHIGQILGLQVAQQWQRRGIATALLQDAIAQASAMGIAQIQLSLTLPNPAAEKLYDRLGFEVYGLERDALRVSGQ